MHKLIIFVSDDRHFYLHLSHVALTAQKSGYEVFILTRASTKKEAIESLGLKVISLPIERFSLNIFKELKILLNIISIYKRQAPDIIHHFGIKPILYGSIAGYILNIKKVINTFLGMGFVFISHKLWVKGIRFTLINTLRFLASRTNMLITVQNKDDAELIKDYNITETIISLCSVGINTSKFKALPEPAGEVTFAIVARLIYDKGIIEFIEAAKLLKADTSVKVKFLVVGTPDPSNYRSISLEQLDKWQKDGIIRWLGYCDNIEQVWKQAHVAALPSYREGLSVSLLEAAAFARPLITTNAPGGRELVTDGVNGLLVNIKDHISLADAMKKLALNHKLRLDLGKRARKLIMNEYDQNILSEKTIRLYYD